MRIKNSNFVTETKKHLQYDEENHLCGFCRHAVP